MARAVNGSTDFINCGSPSEPTQATLAVWFKATALPAGYGNIIGRINSETPNKFTIIYLRSTGALAYYCEVNDPGAGTLGPAALGVDPGSGTITTGVWHHAALTYTSGNTGTIRGYLDGGLDGSTNSANSPNTYIIMPSSGGCTFYFGNDPAFSRPFNGVVADGSYWNVPLTAFEIAALAKGARPLAIRPKSLLGWWPLGGLQSPEPDLSGNKNNGTLTGTTPAFGPPVMQFTPRWPIFPVPGAVGPPPLVLMAQIIT
jgi:hypothetical protein